MYNSKQLIAAVRARNGIRIEPDDPVFALVTINELVLEEAVRRLSDEMDRRLATFSAGMDQTERRAGKLLAQDVKNAAAQIRAEMQKDIEAAGMKAAYLVYKVDQAHKRPDRCRSALSHGASGLCLLRWHVPIPLTSEGLHDFQILRVARGTVRHVFPVWGRESFDSIWHPCQLLKCGSSGTANPLWVGIVPQHSRLEHALYPPGLFCGGFRHKDSV